MFTRLPPTLLARIVRTPLVDMRPDGALVRLLPNLAGLEAAEAVRIAIRPIPADGYTAVGRMPGIDGYHVACTHSAVTMSAHLGKLIARDAMGEDIAELAPFRPAASSPRTSNRTPRRPPSIAPADHGGGPNFVLVPDPSPEPPRPPVPMLQKLRALLAPRTAPPVPAHASLRPRLVFGFDATASREPAWATARQVTDALVRALPCALDVALAVHGGSRLHTFADVTSNPATLRDGAASIRCASGRTQMLPILSRAVAARGVRVVTYISDVFEESPDRGRKLADETGQLGIRLFVLHDIVDLNARRDAKLFQDLARRTGGCVMPFDASAPDRQRDLLAAVAVYAVGAPHFWSGNAERNRVRRYCSSIWATIRAGEG